MDEITLYQVIPYVFYTIGPLTEMQGLTEADLN